MNNNEISIELVNSILADLSEYTLSKKFSKVAEEIPSNYWDEKYQGDNSTRNLIYRLNEGDLHLKVTFESDSYGERETLTSLKFVKPIIKQITDFE